MAQEKARARIILRYINIAWGNAPVLVAVRLPRQTFCSIERHLISITIKSLLKLCHSDKIKMRKNEFVMRVRSLENFKFCQVANRYYR